MDPFAVRIRYEGDVSQFRKSLRVFTLVVGNAGPRRVDHDSSLLALPARIVGEITFELAIADFVIDCLHHYLGTDYSRCQQKRDARSDCDQPPFPHGSSPSRTFVWLAPSPSVCAIPERPTR